MGKIKEIHSLTFIRNNNCAQKMHVEKNERIFFMLDYFHFLKEQTLNRTWDGYRELCGVDRKNSTAVAKKIMGIYSVDDEEQNIFAGENGSDSRFLGLIQVYITDFTWESAKEIQMCDVEQRLREYRAVIQKSVKACLKEEDSFKIYRTVTSEDFCLVVRSANIERIFSAVTDLMKLQNADNERIFFTFTNIGIECTWDDKKGISIPDIKSIMSADCGSDFVLRFQAEKADLDDIQRLSQSGEGGCSVEMVDGLFGRYDLSVRMDISHFGEILPMLCKNKAGEEIYPQETEGHNEEVIKSPLVRKIAEGMAAGTIKAVNTRIMVNLNGIDQTSVSNVTPWFHQERMQKLKERSKKIRDRIKKYQQEYEYLFLMRKNKFVDLNSMLKRVMDAYDNLAFEIDTHLNWYICSKHLETLADNMQLFLQEADKEIGKDKEKAVDKFLLDYELYISAFEKYINLLQRANQHTIQAPNYDGIIPIDSQKFLIAYEEYVDLIQEKYIDVAWGKIPNDKVCREERKKKRVIIYPEMPLENVEMVEVLQLDRKTKETSLEEDDKFCSLLCRIPIFDYFERPYDLIPLLSHESCHQMLILNRKDRNIFLVGDMMKEVANEIAHFMQIESGDDRYPVKPDALTVLIARCIAENLIKGYEIYWSGEWEKFVSDHLKVSVCDFLKEYLKIDVSRFKNSNISREGIVKRLQELILEISADREKETKKLECVAELFGMAENPTAEAAKKDAYQLILEICEDLLEDVKRFIHEKTKTTSNKNGLTFDADIKEADSFEALDECLLKWYWKISEQLDASQQREVKNGLNWVNRIWDVRLDEENFCWKAENSELEDNRKKLSETLAQKIKEEFVNGKGSAIYSEDKISRVTYWSLSEPMKSAEYLEKVFSKMNFRTIQEIVTRTETRYRESCADIIMCRILGLNSFGYFRMAISLFERLEGYNEAMTEKSLLKERISIVLAVLLIRENSQQRSSANEYVEIDAESLVRKTEEFQKYEVDYMYSHVKELVRAANAEESRKENEGMDILEDFFKVLGIQFAHIVENIKSQKAITDKDSLLDRLCAKDGLKLERDGKEWLYPFLRREAQAYRRTYRILDALERILQKGKWIRIEKKMLNHMLDIYDNAEVSVNVHEVVQKVVGFYNNPDSGNTTNYQKMENMLLFVQDYYYFNRFRKAQDEKEEGM